MANVAARAAPVKHASHQKLMLSEQCTSLRGYQRELETNKSIVAERVHSSLTVPQFAFAAAVVSQNRARCK